VLKGLAGRQNSRGWGGFVRTYEEEGGFRERGIMALVRAMSIGDLSRYDVVSTRKKKPGS